MAQKQTPFSRLQHPDPVTNRLIQDLYDKLQQLQAELAKIKDSIPTP